MERIEKMGLKQMIKKSWKVMLLAACLVIMFSLSSFANTRYTATLEGKGSSWKSSELAYLRCRLKGNKMILNGDMFEIDENNQRIRRVHFNNKKIKLSKKVKYRSANAESGEFKGSRKNVIKATKNGFIGMDLEMKGGKIVKIIIHA